MHRNPRTTTSDAKAVDAMQVRSNALNFLLSMADHHGSYIQPVVAYKEFARPSVFPQLMGAADE